MTGKYRIAFYAPLKPPDHAIASGDRQMARMLLAALQRTGHDAFLASRYISYSKRHGAEHMAQRKQGAAEEAGRLLKHWQSEGNAPDLWFCYHPYDKSPDWLGMAVCHALSIPMVTAEPCKTGQGPDGEWLPWRAEAQRGIKQAAMNIVMTPSDFDYVSSFVPPERITRLDPFVDTDLLATGPLDEDPWPRPGGTRLLTVGMMRPGAKLDSYTVLAEALAGLSGYDWSLVVAGDGPGREQIAQMLGEAAPGRVRLLGETDGGTVLALMEAADILAWPGCREAYGMVYLEAATCGLPAAALENMGVPLVVADGRSGLLADPTSPGAYREVLARMIGDTALRQQLSQGAAAFALKERSGTQAASRLSAIIDQVMTRQE